jgi:hypothetical protein
VVSGQRREERAAGFIPAAGINPAAGFIPAAGINPAAPPLFPDH